MKQKLFDKKRHPKKCANCFYGTSTQDGLYILCDKKGKVDPADVCRRYKYDPLKREPQQAVFDFGYSADDFKL